MQTTRIGQRSNPNPVCDIVRFRFGIRTLLVLTVLAAVGICWWLPNPELRSSSLPYVTYYCTLPRITGRPDRLNWAVFHNFGSSPEFEKLRSRLSPDQITLTLRSSSGLSTHICRSSEAQVWEFSHGQFKPCSSRVTLDEFLDFLRLHDKREWSCSSLREFVAERRR